MCFDLAGVADPILVEFACEFRIDPGRNELLLSAGQRLFQGSLNEAVRYADRGYLAFVQQTLKVAVGDRCDLVGNRDRVLNHKHQKDGSNRVSDIEAGLICHGQASGSHAHNCLMLRGLHNLAPSLESGALTGWAASRPDRTVHRSPRPNVRARIAVRP